MSLLTQLQSKTEQEKALMAGIGALALMLLLFVFWGTIAFSRSDTQAAPTKVNDASQSAASLQAVIDDESKAIQELVETLQEEGKLNPDDAAKNFVRIYLDENEAVQTEQINR